jgi:hypothetical protein
MTEYERGLRDAARVCRTVARAEAPWRKQQYDDGRLTRSTNVSKRERARGAIRCAIEIESLAK